MGVAVENKYSSCGMAGNIAIVVIAAILIITIAVGILYYQGYLGNFTFVLSEEGSRVEYTRPGERSKKVIGALKDIAEAQNKYRDKYGTYAPVMEFLLGEGYVNGEIGTATNSMLAFEGYYFVGLKKQGRGFVNLKKGFVMAAIPSILVVTI